MNEVPDSQRLFNEKDVSRILKRATEIQARTDGEGYGLSLAELQQIARDVGIAPEAVAAAAAELDTEEHRGFHVLGGPLSFSVDRVVAGEVTDETWEAMLDEIRRTYHLAGVSSRVGRSMEWTYGGNRQQTQVAVTARDGRVQLRVTEHYPRVAVHLFAPLLALFLSLAPMIAVKASPGWVAALVLLIGFIAVFMTGHLMFRGISRKKERKARQLLQRLERLVAAPSSARPALAQQPEAVPEASARIPLPEPEASAIAAPTPASARRMRS